jgi:hypothetical protein
MSWTLDGDEYTDTSTTTHDGDTIDLESGETGEWECTVTPDDGDDEGSEATATY